MKKLSSFVENKNILLFAKMLHVAGVGTACLLVVTLVYFSPTKAFKLSSMAKRNLVLMFVFNIDSIAREDLP